MHLQTIEVNDIGLLFEKTYLPVFIANRVKNKKMVSF
jgi:hypothetical protein